MNQSGYRSLPQADYDKDFCLIPHEVLQFIQATQPKEYQKLHRQYRADTSQKLLLRISKVIANRGVLEVLRNGVKDRGTTLKLTYFRPSSGMNPNHEKLYIQNRFTLIRQLKYSTRNEKSLDMVLFLNGLPLVTMELKNSLTGQVVGRRCGEAVQGRSGPQRAVVQIQAVSGSLRGREREGLNDNPLAGSRHAILPV